MNFSSKEEYFNNIKKRAILPVGFKCAISKISFFPKERKLENPLNMNLSLILMDKPTTSFAGVFTQNSFPGSPVLIGREMLKQKYAQGVLVNNKISNVCQAEGVNDAKKIISKLSKVLKIDDGLIFPSSTGIIGWRLPVKEMIDAMPKLTAEIGNADLADVAKNIMTTDSYPKLHSEKIGTGRIVAIAKGAGMIEPNMATMLSFILTDITISKKDLQRVLIEVANKSYNTISVDSDQSTSDTVLAFSSCEKPAVDVEEFKEALLKVCSRLSQDIVRNGEGVEHVIKVSVKGAKNDKDARGVGKAIINSPLFKSAIFGNDPNVGRIISSIGDYYGNSGLGAIDKNGVSISIGTKTVFKNGGFQLSQNVEKSVNEYLKGRQLKTVEKRYPEHDKSVEIFVTLPLGEGEATVIGGDLTYDYVKENADYRS